jgi:hypothetical protein
VRCGPGARNPVWNGLIVHLSSGAGFLLKDTQLQGPTLEALVDVMASSPGTMAQLGLPPLLVSGSDADA